MSKQNPIDLTQMSQAPHNDSEDWLTPEDSDVEILSTPPTKKVKTMSATPAKSSSSSEEMECKEEMVYQCPYCEDVNWDEAMVVDQCNICRNLKVLIQDLCTCDARWAEAADENCDDDMDRPMWEYDVKK